MFSHEIRARRSSPEQHAVPSAEPWPPGLSNQGPRRPAPGLRADPVPANMAGAAFATSRGGAGGARGAGPFRWACPGAETSWGGRADVRGGASGTVRKQEVRPGVGGEEDRKKAGWQSPRLRDRARGMRGENAELAALMGHREERMGREGTG